MIPLANSLGKGSIYCQTEFRIYTQDFADNLKRQVVEIIASKEDELDQQLRAMSERLSEKEEDLANVKRLFVDKLRELESSFVELS